MTHREVVLSVLSGGALCDDCLADKSGVHPRQTINILCRDLENEGSIRRVKADCPACKKHKILNQTAGSTIPSWEQGAAISTATAGERPWYWEGNVQQKIVEYFQSQGLQVTRTANTASREAGVDIRAMGKTGRELLVSVKGYPDKSSNTQARHWFAEAIFDIVLYRQQYPDCHYAIGLPDGFTTYQNLARRVGWLKKAAPFSFIWVKEDGDVTVK
jgi:hypothetical protein